ncbi:hypothetical protein SNEBB_000082 [Seison nebaliae]|nr:hypothetical protein SNEBB_000082 [Seison nebaliae]
MADQPQLMCTRCNTSLNGGKYIVKDEKPYCLECYENNFANVCEACGKKIGTQSKDLSYKEKHWHEECFRCSVCNRLLAEIEFGTKDEKLYCGDCFNDRFASRCDFCNEIFKPGAKKMEYKGKQYHDKCFVCFNCKEPIGTNSFIPKDEQIYCVKCYEDKFATKCTKCGQVIVHGGVTYRKQPWHRECFVCTNCGKQLTNSRFTSRDDQPFCEECFGEKFAKRCAKCKQPITGIGGTKYVTFEDRHWHSNCFKCDKCSESLVAKGFVTDNDKIYCADCGKTLNQ